MKFSETKLTCLHSVSFFLRFVGIVGVIVFPINNCTERSANVNKNLVIDTAIVASDELLIRLSQEDQWKKKAKRMVDLQIRSRGVSDIRVLKAMEETPRHLFVPKNSRRQAFEDHPLPIGQGQTISQPYVVALMTEMLQLKGNEKVLEIGTGSGYQSAILSQLVKEVYSIEIVKSLADSSSTRLKRMGYNNVLVKWGDGYQGWPEHAPFDAIILTAAPSQTPPKLVDQLKPGGIMVLPIGNYYQELKIISKSKDGKLKERSAGGVRFVPMVHPIDSSFQDGKN